MTMNISDLGDGKMTIKIAGVAVEVAKEAGVKETLKAELENRGISSFVILVDGEEITNTDDLPDTFEDCDTVEVQRYTKPGRN